MDEQQSNFQRPVNPRRRRRTKMQNFKEAYLPVVIAGAAVVLVLIFMIGSITRAVQKNQAEKQALAQEAIAAQQRQAELEAQAQSILEQAQALTVCYDYDGAIAAIDSFPGSIEDFPALSERRSAYVAALSSMVAWDDPSQVTVLSFQLLLADLQMGLNYSAYANTINRSFVTTGEFTQIITQLYDNGYVLVRMDDFISEDYAAKTLYLPEGKKPLLLTQVNVNYNYYLIDSDGDKLPDKDAGGFASRLLLDESGSFICERTDSSGQTVTGDFDLVPILEKFIAEHPDFSYKGARAMLAVTGYNGLFGYRTDRDASDENITAVRTLAEALTDRGYELACYTYSNIAYGRADLTKLQGELESWNSQVVPILGTMDTLVYAQQSDIDSSTGAYTGDKFELLHSAGFNRFVGFCSSADGWVSLQSGYVRLGRINVTGSSLAHHPQWFEGMFDAAAILDPARGEVPE